MENIIEDDRRSLSDLRRNLETGLYSPPAAFDGGKGLTGLNPVSGPSGGTSRAGEAIGDASAKPMLARKNSFNSSSKIVSGSRLI